MNGDRSQRKLAFSLSTALDCCKAELNERVKGIYELQNSVHEKRCVTPISIGLKLRVREVNVQVSSQQKHFLSICEHYEGHE